MELQKKELYKKYIREIEWAIKSPNIINEAYWETNSFNLNEWLEKIFIEFQSKKSNINQNLLSALINNSKHQQRLGRYFETLLEGLFFVALKINPIFKNILIMNEKITTGELDFILKNPFGTGFIHLETAIKFYLFSENDMLYWGPNGIDRLDLKLKQLKCHQIPLIKNNNSKAFLEEKKIHPIQSACLLKGYLFYHFSKPIIHDSLNKEINSSHLKGWWAFVNELDPFFNAQATKSRWIILEKKDWIGPFQAEKSKIKVFTSSLIKDEIYNHFKSSNRSLMIIKLHEKTASTWGEISRGFIVKESWPNLTQTV